MNNPKLSRNLVSLLELEWERFYCDYIKVWITEKKLII